MPNILVIEDDEKINNLLCRIFENKGWQVKSAENGYDGLQLALKNNYSLIVMDLMLPLKTGEEVLREIRGKKDTPVIILSAKSQTADRIGLLRLGADDYIIKPFDIDEVVLRIEAVLRRSISPCSTKLTFRDIALDTDAKRVYVCGKEIVCTAMEYAILELMLRNPSRIFSKRNLFESITGEDYISDENAMNVHISNIRKKIRRISSSQHIETVYGMGYRLL